MATCIHPSRSCLLPFYNIPIFPLLNQKIFHLLVSFLFLDAHCIYFILSGILYCLRVFVVVYILVVFISCCWNCVISGGSRVGAGGAIAPPFFFAAIFFSTGGVCSTYNSSPAWR